MPYRLPERRQHVRILTLKNFGVALVIIAVVLVAANLLSEVRKTTSGSYGALFGHELKKAEPVVPRKVEVVTEAPAVPDRDAADPLLLAPAAREQQYLTPNSGAPVAVAAVAPQSPVQPAPKVDTGRVGIVGDENGVAVVGQRKLAGGFGR